MDKDILMTTLCSPIDCETKDSCLRYATEDILERSPWSQFADFSQDLKIGGKCPWYKPKEERDSERDNE